MAAPYVINAEPILPNIHLYFYWTLFGRGLAIPELISKFELDGWLDDVPCLATPATAIVTINRLSRPMFEDSLFGLLVEQQIPETAAADLATDLAERFVLDVEQRQARNN